MGTGADQPPVLVVQVEQPFQLDPRVGPEPAVPPSSITLDMGITARHSVLSAGSRADVPQPPCPGEREKPWEAAQPGRGRRASGSVLSYQACKAWGLGPG